MENEALETVRHQNLTVQALSAKEVLDQVELVQSVMKSVMKIDEHYGIIPGTKKPTLYKSGAEKLCFTFRLRPEFVVDKIDIKDGHREYEVTCNLYSAADKLLGQGVGVCSSMESKYRFRTGEVVFTGKPVPADYWALRKNEPLKAQFLLGGRGYQVRKNDNSQWEIVRAGEKIENENIADVFNSIKKIAKKRAFVDAVLTVTAASDIFTQEDPDIPEDTPDMRPSAEPSHPSTVTEHAPNEAQPAPSSVQQNTEAKEKLNPNFETAKHLLSIGHPWNKKIYKGNAIYINNQKLLLNQDEIARLTDFCNALESEYTADQSDLPFDK